MKTTTHRSSYLSMPQNLDVEMEINSFGIAYKIAKGSVRSHELYWITCPNVPLDFFSKRMRTITENLR